MATTITLNSVSLNAGNYRISRVLHDSSPVLDINALEIARRDGATLISTTYKPKEITIEGWITGSDQATMEGYLDAIKRDCVKSNINLDIAYAGSTRRYVVTAKSYSVIRESYDINKVRYTLSLICLSPFALSTTEQEALSVVGITGSSYETTMTVDGTAMPSPTIRYTIDNGDNLGTITFTNATTGKQIEVGTAFGSGDLLVIDCENRTVQLNSQDVEFEGVFPTFDIGINSITTTLSTTNAVDVQQLEFNDSFSFTTSYGEMRLAQSFTPATSTLFTKVSLFCKSISEPTYGYHTFSIQTDSSDSPSGTAVSGSTVGMTITSFEFAWYDVSFSSPVSLTAGTKYWIVIKKDPGMASVGSFGFSNANHYATYYMKSYFGSVWTSYSNSDLCFRLYKDATIDYSVDWEINYYPKYL